MAPDEVREDTAGPGEADMGALANGQVAEGLGDVGLADADRAEDDDRLTRVQPAQGSRVPDLSRGQLP
ncbi:hypothetical protein GCM10010121_087110 [Streptomyces brasiliensis]|uniref:Uncharacterized protein n=1 Tax=Streptomyces brasiliensis TaxID=1954 RepID=A0A917P5Z5_9ACTN|nr:hypothetical protein GCM10010121_087110 [Streptomyces brasiliensis]